MLDLDRIDDAVRHENGLSRRLFIGYAAALAATPLLGSRALAQGAPTSRPSFATNPFTLGVASGDPDATSVVLWTKLAPRPLDPDGGMPKENVAVAWEVADDEQMTRVVARGTAVATAGLGHSVHVEAAGLAPDRWYFYRFRAGDYETPVARTRTMPADGQTPDKLRFAFASCQHYEAGHYTAYREMAKDELDLVFFLGDYIYEGPPRDGQPRKHGGPRTTNLETYRMRHAQYKTDPLLQAQHARCPWWVTWDDHEVVNNYAGDVPGTDKFEPARFLQRRAAAYKAYYEFMPLRAASLPRGADMQLYRRGRFGKLAAFNVLDTRQYRADQPNDDKASPLNDNVFKPDQSVLGKKQRAWLEDGLASSDATWNVIPQQIMMGMLGRRKKHEPDDGGHDEVYSMDSWTGYAGERIDLVKFMADRKVRNPVILTGDVHANYVNDLRVDDRQTDKPVIASEFVGTSISSGGDGVDVPPGLEDLVADNAGLRYHNRERGYVRCTVDAKQWRADYVTVSQVAKPDGKSQVRASFVVESDRPGIQKA